MYQMAEDCVGGQALDDRCGMAAILHALQLVKGEKLPCAVAVLFSTQEEVGERGASIGAYTINPDIAIAVDVTFALGHGDDPVKCGKLGGGPMIGISPSLSRVVSNQLIAAAKENEIPWQPEVMAGTTGTNADQFSVTRGGIQACTVSIPLRYMHTPTEVIALSDVEQTGKLLAAYLRRCSL
jgi:endoglucanase